MKDSRLFQLLYYLLEKESATASELAEKLEVSVRTIYRDLDSLSAAGIPIYTETGRNGGIYLSKEFVLNKALLSKEEKEEILTSLQSLSSLHTSSNTLEKLAGVFKIQPEDWIEIDFSRWGNTDKDNEKFESLKEAVLKHNRAEITYANTWGEIQKRKIEPLKLCYKSSAWYLKAYCLKKEDFRLFKLNRILDLKVLEEKFIPKLYPKTEDEKPIFPLCEFEIKFPNHLSYRVFDEFDYSQIKRCKDGSLLVKGALPYDDWLIGYLLSFMGEAEIIKPESLKAKLLKEAEKIQKIYKP